MYPGYTRLQVYASTQDHDEMADMTPAEESAADYGFLLWQTGGGCTALARKLGGDPDTEATDAPYIMITATEDASAPVAVNELSEAFYYDESDEYEPITQEPVALNKLLVLLQTKYQF